MSHKSSHSHNHDAPHDSMVGAIIALVVVSIVFEGIFFGAWWATLVQVILTIHMIKEIVMYISNAEVRRNYHYSTTGEDVWHFWLALIIVSAAMSLIFPYDPWFARIAPAVLSIKAIETTILYFISRNNRNNQKHTQHVAHHSHMYGQSQSVRPMIRVVVESDESNHNSLDREVANYSSISVKTPSDSGRSASFCSMCGKEHDSADRFCPSCGSELRT